MGTITEKYKNKTYIRYIPRCHEVLDQFIKFINSDILLKSVSFLNSSVYFWDIDFHSKWGLSSDNTPPHQDSFLKCLSDNSPHMLTCYIPLTEIGMNSNPMHIIRGSYKSKTMKHHRSKKLGFSSVIAEKEDLLPKRLLINEYPVLLSPGDAFFFHGKTIHYSKSPTSKISNLRRMAIAIRIIGCNAKFSEKRTKEYLANVRYNRQYSIKKGLTEFTPKKIRTI